LETARTLVARCLRLPIEVVTEQTRRGLSEGWDSLAHVTIVNAVEGILGRELTTTEILGLESVKTISELFAVG
jgi:acyl carrier protein